MCSPFERIFVASVSCVRRHAQNKCVIFFAFFLRTSGQWFFSFMEDVIFVCFSSFAPFGLKYCCSIIESVVHINKSGFVWARNCSWCQNNSEQLWDFVKFTWAVRFTVYIVYFCFTEKKHKSCIEIEMMRYASGEKTYR